MLAKVFAPIFLFSICLLSAACGMSPVRPGSELSNATPNDNAININAININTATLDELQRIPHVGEKVASKIIEYRETNGPFRRVEHLMLIQGISDKRFRKIRPLVRVE